MKEPKTTILFDFDGTLAETMMLIHEIFNRLSGVYGYRHLPDEELETCRHLTVHQFIERAGIPHWKVPLIAIHARRLMHRDMGSILPPRGLVDVLTRIHQSGRYEMDILTSNRKQNVCRFLERHRIDWFDRIEATQAIFSKRRRVSKYIRSRGLNAGNLYYVGDTTIDVDSARRAGAKTVAVSWGLNTTEALASVHPDHLVDSPDELLEIFPVS